MMSRGWLVLLTLTLLTLVSGCGQSAFIDIAVNSDPTNPRQSEALSLRLSERDSAIVLDRRYSIDELEHDFPIHIVVEPRSTTAKALLLEVVAFFNEVPVAVGEVDFEWQSDEVTRVAVTLTTL